MRGSESETLPEFSEDHTSSRVKLKLYGRFMLEDRSEHPCQVYEMSTGNLAMRSDRIAEPGEKVIIYLDHLGRLEGVATQTAVDGFTLAILASNRKRDKLAAQLHWLANRQEHALPEDRRHERTEPLNPISELHLGDGRTYQCRIIDLSLSGAGIEIDVRPALGTSVTLGTMRGTVVRHFDEGIAIEFASVQPAGVVDSELPLSNTAA